MSKRNTEPWELSLIKYLSATLAQKYPKTWEENQHWLRDIIENRQNLLAEGYDYWKVVLITFWYLLPFGWSTVCEIAKRFVLESILLYNSKNLSQTLGLIRRNLLPEEWYAEVEAIRYKQFSEGKSVLLVEILTFILCLNLFKSYLQIKIEG